LNVEVEGSMLLAFVISLQAVIYTYDGWSGAIYFSEEFREPGKQIPRSMFGGIGAVIVIYLLINIAFLRVLPLASIAGRNLAAGVVAQHLFGVYGDTVLRSLTIVALISAVNSNLMMAPRVLFAMSRDRLFWRGAAEVNAGGTPDVALLISTILTAAFIVTGTFEAVIAKLAFCFVANYSLSFVSLFVLRHTAPDAPRPWRAWGHPVTTAIALVASLAFLASAVISDTRNSLWSLGFLALSWPVYWMGKRMRR
ncbi:MAG TPA: APC family permease, partial [Thermoanaerobaculia bacterium]|nr:APC family permease [Thermoanaerobaculia bacterium]